MRGGLRLLLMALALAAALAFPRAVEASGLWLGPLTCTGGADSARAALELPAGSLECDPAEFLLQDRFVRTHTDLSGQFLPTGRMLVWQTNPTSFDAMLIRFTYADGSRSLVDVDPQMAVRNWFAGNRFSVPVPRAQLPLIAIDTVIERPRAAATARDARLMSSADAQYNHFGRSLIYALFCGLFIAPIIFDLLFYRVLRARFMAWHIAMTAAMLLFVLANSGLIFLLVPDMPLALRWHLNIASLTAAIVCATYFICGMLEQGKVPRRLGLILHATTLFTVLINLVLLVETEPLRIIIFRLYLMSFIPVALAMAVVLALAIKRGSRAAVFAVIALSGLMFTGLVQLAWLAGLLPAAVPLADMLVGALVVMALGTAAGVADRFLVIRLQRDRARHQASRLSLMAHSDALTGLANRRAFDQLARLPKGYGLIVADIDRFKAINDRCGHLVGDAVLGRTARVLHETLSGRRGGRAYRLGGEEFAIVVPAADREDLAEMAEHIRFAIERGATADDPNDDLPGITVSIGGVLGTGQPLHEAYADADGALYRAKDMGRNRIVVGPIE